MCTACGDTGYVKVTRLMPLWGSIFIGPLMQSCPTYLPYDTYEPCLCSWRWRTTVGASLLPNEFSPLPINQGTAA